MITITVDGDRGEGKTTTALRIAAMLRSKGFAVEYRGSSKEATARLEAGLRDPDLAELLLAGQLPRTFLVKDES
jgi:hypothetical protein